MGTHCTFSYFFGIISFTMLVHSLSFFINWKRMYPSVKRLNTMYTIHLSTRNHTKLSYITPPPRQNNQILTLLGLSWSPALAWRSRVFLFPYGWSGSPTASRAAPRGWHPLCLGPDVYLNLHTCLATTPRE